MPRSDMFSLHRRGFLAGSAAAAALTLPGVAAAADNPSAPVQRLLVLASQAALAGLAAPDGFWNSRVARFGLPVLFKRGSDPNGPLNRDESRLDLSHRLNNVAEPAARRVAPVVAEAARALTISNPAVILQGPQTSATSYLRLEMGGTLVSALLQPLEETLVAAQDPVILAAVATLPGVTLRDVAHGVAITAENGIWYEIGAAEVAIRASPDASGDAALAAALRGV